MSYLNKIHVLKQLEEQKSKLMENINTLYKTITEKSGPVAENKPKKHKVNIEQEQNEQM